MQTTKIFTADVRCENSDRMCTMHTSDYRRFVWYENQRLHWFHQSARLLTGEQTEDDENARVFTTCGERKVYVWLNKAWLEEGP